MRFRRPSLKSLIVIAVCWDFLIVVFGMLFAPPFQGITSGLSLPDSLIRFFYPYEALFFHALAMPFIAVLAYATLGIFGSKGRWASAVTFAVSLGFVLSSASAMYIVFRGADYVAFGILWIGLAFGAFGGLGLLVTTWPSKQKDQVTISLRGRNLASLCVWVSVLGVLSAAAIGAYASTGSSMWGAASTIPSG